VLESNSLPGDPMERLSDKDNKDFPFPSLDKDKEVENPMLVLCRELQDSKP
jgi:hypothetical protein